MRDISQSQWVNCDLTRRYVGLNLSQHARSLNVLGLIDRWEMTSFRQREGAFLLKTPDLVLPDLDAPRSFTIVDIKIVDPTAASYVDT